MLGRVTAFFYGVVCYLAFLAIFLYAIGFLGNFRLEPELLRPGQFRRTPSCAGHDGERHILPCAGFAACSGPTVFGSRRLSRLRLPRRHHQPRFLAARIWRPIRNTDKARDSQGSTLRRSFMNQSTFNCGRGRPQRGWSQTRTVESTG